MSSVECTLALDGGFALRSAGSTDLAANLGGALPVVRHCADGGVMWCVWMVIELIEVVQKAICLLKMFRVVVLV